MSTRSRTLLLAVAAIGLSAAALATEGPNLGKPVSPQDIAPWDITVMPDGTGLPAGSGTAVQGAPIFVAKCSACHGDKGTGGIAATAADKTRNRSAVRFIESSDTR